MDEKDKLLGRIADQLDKWADDSLSGGWSTHQVRGQRELAIQLRNVVLLGRSYEQILKR